MALNAVSSSPEPPVDPRGGTVRDSADLDSWFLSQELLTQRCVCEGALDI